MKISWEFLFHIFTSGPRDALRCNCLQPPSFVGKMVAFVCSYLRSTQKSFTIYSILQDKSVCFVLYHRIRRAENVIGISRIFLYFVRHKKWDLHFSVFFPFFLQCNTYLWEGQVQRNRVAGFTGAGIWEVLPMLSRFHPVRRQSFPFPLQPQCSERSMHLHIQRSSHPSIPAVALSAQQYEDASFRNRHPTLLIQCTY